MRATILTTIACSLFLTMTGQSLQEHHCSLGQEDGALVKERMLHNRNSIDPNLIAEFQSQREDYTYIPITFHIIRKDDGSEGMQEELVFRTFCRLNEDYQSLGIQFYLKMPWRYVDNTELFDNSHEGNAHEIMESEKISNCVNIFCGPSTNSPTSSYYSPSNDFVFMLKAMMGDTPTISHETGHFFTLPHTFYGWEGEDARDYENTNAPNSNGGWNGTTELFTRSGGNCNNAADGFCDTPADFISFRTSCPMNWNLLDADGDAIDPDEENVMSYYQDACVVGFTPEQSSAVLSDIFARGWSNFPEPNLDVVSMDYEMTNGFPEDGAEVDFGGNITLEWDAVTNAEYYLLQLDKSHPIAPVSLANIFTEVVDASANPSYTFSMDMLELDQTYRWSILPFTKYSTCAPISDYNKFKPVDNVGVNELSDQFELFPNPVKNSLFIVSKDLKEIDELRIYTIEGKLMEIVKIEDANKAIDLNFLSKGTYLIKIVDSTGRVGVQKLIKL